MDKPRKPQVIHTKYGLQVEYDPLTPHYGNYFEFEERKQLDREKFTEGDVKNENTEFQF